MRATFAALLVHVASEGSLGRRMRRSRNRGLHDPLSRLVDGQLVGNLWRRVASNCPQDPTRRRALSLIEWSKCGRPPLCVLDLVETESLGDTFQDQSQLDQSLGDRKRTRLNSS